ncbi:hypothetical protein WJX72_005019 [[Myrmecia] bisecta]|uniref:Amidohydrolase-related domain-containing protein n=1 Tax=[Myrmecia] bisecta TaxID=41462 RepID=A0AAW1Q333_9CHLO
MKLQACCLAAVLLCALAPAARARLVTLAPTVEDTQAGCDAVKQQFAGNHNLVVVGATILALDAANSVYPGGIVSVLNGTINYVGPPSGFDLATAPANSVILQLNASDIVLPGLINTHTHSAMTLLRGIGNDQNLSTWLNDYIFPSEAALEDPGFIRAGVKIALAEYLQSGVTTFADMYFFQDDAAQVVSQVGMRAVLGSGMIDFPQPDGATPDIQLANANAVIRKWKGHPLITPAISPHAPYTTSASVYAAAVNVSQYYDVPLLTHCAETATEDADTRTHNKLGPNVTAIGYLQSVGALTNRTICAHTVWVDDADVALIVDSGTKVAHCPRSNLKLADGIMHYKQLTEAGVVVSIGTDGPASNNIINLFGEMQTAALLHKGVSLDPTLLPAIEALRMATNQGARAINRFADLGSIEVGKKGDFAIVDGDRASLLPRYGGTADDIAVRLVYAANDDIRATVVDGQVLYLNNCYTTLDVEAAYADAAGYAANVTSFLAASAANKTATN